MVWSKGDKYEGEWSNDKQNGEGTYFWVNGDKYIGSFKDDNFNGYGELYKADGTYYKGNFVDGFVNGYVEVYDKENKLIAKGIFKDNELIEEQKEPEKPAE